MLGRHRSFVRILCVAGVSLAVLAAGSCSDGDDVIERGDFTVQITIAGDGSGQVSHDLGDEICADGVCTWGFYEGLTVTLTAEASAGSVFAGWSGDCAGVDPDCTLVVDEQLDVTATFDPE